MEGFKRGFKPLPQRESKGYSLPMPSVEFESDAARRQLERVLQSSGFTRNERLSRFLRFLVERYLEGRQDELKESVIGTEVFGRRPDYDPKQDAIVRTEAGRLRARLSEYYLSAGKDDPLVIEVPKGGYVPVLRQALAPAGGAGTGLSSGPAFRPGLWIAIACFAVALAATAWWWTRHQNAPIPIGVLPLINLNQDATDDYFADGLTGEIIRNLSIIDGLAVRSETSSFTFKGKTQKARDAGRLLEADYILEGSVLRAGNRLRVNVQFVRARDDFPLWSEKYDRELTDVFAIQDEISRGIVNSLRLMLGRGRRRYETSTEAYDLYLRARGIPTAIDTAPAAGRFDFYQQAIAKDPSFAPAYAGLATTYALRSGVTFDGDLLDELSMREMRSAAEKAIQLDPLLAEAHDALGAVYARDARWQESEKTFRHAIELDSNNSSWRADFAMDLLLPLGRIDEAIQQLQTAEKADPLSPDIQGTFGAVLISAGRYEEAVGHCQKASGLDHIECLGRARLGQGRIDEAIQILEAASLPRWLAYAYGRAGGREEAERLATPDKGRLLQRVLAYAGLGDKDRTLEALNAMIPLGPVRIGRTLTFPELAFLRGDPRLRTLRKNIGLPE
jgi:adenylate cyclase